MYPGYHCLKIENERKIGKRKREKEEIFFPSLFFLFIIFLLLWYPGEQGKDPE